MLLRIVLLIAVAWIVYRVFFQRPRKALRVRSQAPAYQDTIRCDHCGIHLPADKALRTGEGSYCSADHAEAARRH